jgi:hypothetical protein
LQLVGVGVDFVLVFFPGLQDEAIDVGQITPGVRIGLQYTVFVRYMSRVENVVFVRVVSRLPSHCSGQA